MDPELSANLEMLACEAFIRRAATLEDAPFMLKGSYVTRQYFPNPTDRIPADLDWVYLRRLHDVELAQRTFNTWARTVTVIEMNDGVKYRSFKENEFWRRIDYAMADDFPTVNTDLLCWVDGVETQISIDVSFNLNIDQPPALLLYRPLHGEEFFVPSTVPLSLQVAWKIHQTLVRPRFKDLFDLIYLVRHPEFNKERLADAMQSLVNECRADKTDLSRLRLFLEGNLEGLFPKNGLKDGWAYWRHNDYSRNNILHYGTAKHLTDAAKLPEQLADFLVWFKVALQRGGLDVGLMEALPAAAPKRPSL